MHRIHPVADDFEALIRIIPAREGGPSSPRFNGIRWDFQYALDTEVAPDFYMIWPDFHDKDGNSLTKDIPLPVGIDIPARMVVVVDESRSIHASRIVPGSLFRCCEGSTCVATGRVTRITGLFDKR